jgi:hypothetical protein
MMGRINRTRPERTSWSLVMRPDTSRVTPAHEELL